MAEFSYESDIAPLRGSYFSSPNLNDRERRQLQSDYAQKIAPYQEITSKTLERMLDVQNQELSYRRANTAFEEEKLKLQEARDAASLYPKISSQLEAAMSGRDPDEQRILVADVMMQNPTFFKTENGSALISAVNSKISAGAAAKAEDRAKTNQVWNMAAQMGMPDIADKVSSGLLSSNDALKELTARRKEISLLEEVKEIATKQSETAYKLRTDFIDRADDVYRSIKLVGGQTFDPNDTELGKTYNYSEVLPKNTKFTDTYKNQVILKLSGLLDKTPEEVEEMAAEQKLSDVDLHDLLGRRIEFNRTQLYRDITGRRDKPIPTTQDLEKGDYLFQSFGNK